MSELNVGDVLRLRNVRHYLEDGKSWMEHGVKKGSVLVVMLMGIEPHVLTAPEQALDPTKVLDAMGWERKKPKKSRAVKRAK